MNRVDELIKERSHLESPLSFYKKVREYTRLCFKGMDVSKKKESILYVIETFSLVFGLPKDSILFLSDELSEKGIDPFHSPSLIFRLSLYHDDLKEEEKERFLFLVSRPFFMLLRKDRDDSFTKSGRCPICGEPPSIGRITSDNRKRLICSFCEYEGEFYRIGCPFCLNKEGQKIDILLDDDEIRVELCNNCKSYMKSMREDHILKYGDPYLVDILSLPLDVIAQEKGYIRRSPNLIGVQNIIR